MVTTGINGSFYIILLLLLLLFFVLAIFNFEAFETILALYLDIVKY